MKRRRAWAERKRTGLRFSALRDLHCRHIVPAGLPAARGDERCFRAPAGPFTLAAWADIRVMRELLSAQALVWVGHVNWGSSWHDPQPNILILINPGEAREVVIPIPAKAFAAAIAVWEAGENFPGRRSR